jgi:regulator of sirC expression with transglutaminase-like and TPR domain
MNIKILGLGLAIGCLSLNLASCNGAKEQAKKASIPDAKVEQAKISTAPAITTKINPPANIDKLSPNDKSSQKVAKKPDPKESAKKIATNTQIIKLHPNDAKAYNDRAIAYKEQKQYPQALADFTKAAELFKEQKNTTSYQQAMTALQQLKSVMIK